MRVDESWQARVCMSVSSTLIARSNEQWELHGSWQESFFFFRFPCFCSLLLRFFFFVFWRLSNCWQSESLLQLSLVEMIRNNNYFLFFFFFSFFFFVWVMTWKSLASATLYDSRATLMTGQTSQTSHWLSSKFEPAQSWWECMRVDESWRSKESESCDSHPPLSSFDQAFSYDVYLRHPIFVTRYSTAISQCKRHSLFRTAPFLHVSANTKIWWIIVRVCREYLKNYVKHPFKIKGYILMNFAIPWKNPGESTEYCTFLVPSPCPSREMGDVINYKSTVLQRQCRNTSRKCYKNVRGKCSVKGPSHETSDLFYEYFGSTVNIFDL